MDQREIVEDPKGLTSQQDHERDMELVELEVISVTLASPSVKRVLGRIKPAAVEPWLHSNTAVRIDVEVDDRGNRVNRIYTIRSFSPERLEVEIDFVLHEDNSPAMRWLSAAGPGTRVMMKGPRAHQIPNFGSGKPLALFADDTAIPAVYAMLQAWPADAPAAEVFVDTADAEAYGALHFPPDVRGHLLLRDAGQHAGTAFSLIAAARQLMQEPLAWSVWACGERDEMIELRRFLREAGLLREDMRIMGYWRRGMSNSEMDRLRLQAYERILAEGKGVEEFRDSEVAL